MNYLFFDCEFASSKGGIERICEFGYVIVDEKFSIVEKDNLIINPNIDRKDWDYYALKKILTRKRIEYENNPSFFYYYNRIKNAIENVDYVFGHNPKIVSNDANFRDNRILFYQFIDNVKPLKNGDKLKDKKVSITKNYEKTHFKQILNLIQLITDEGGKFILKASQSDIFIKYDSYDEAMNLCDDLRYNYVIDANQNGSNIEIVEFKEFLKIFELNEEELDAMTLPSFDFLLSSDAIIKNKETKRILDNQKETVIDPYIEDYSMSSVGELFGDFFNNLIGER